ncbi:Uma2 family endonuclease [Alienimonas chondri]|uniref:Putative restriction endonuclease domain-containing protein n=1 Tax=Alienimonas chondri TaxID=2681879 RepID=A0ABX1VA26_9PLAN|nr:Uma2 family endonuclease [Alienimonas chondri]NNJ24618.1 hypothetical protein [Alienimonas chondri]
MIAATPVRVPQSGPLIQDPLFARQALDERRRSGLDRYDEVWDGRYIFMPLPGLEHQDCVDRICYQLNRHLDDSGSEGRVQPGANVSDRADDWTKNYRCPDVLLFLPGNPAEAKGSHWLGGPDLAVEVLSEGDLALEKLPFYASVGVRELWMLDREPWRLSRYRLTDGALTADGVTEPGGAPIRSALLPLDWSLSADDPPTVRLSPTE